MLKTPPGSLRFDVRIGTAGWAVPRGHADRFPAAASGLARYAGVFGATEINSSFYKPHRTGTYVRWAASVPDEFRFSVKLPRQITHEQRLVASDGALAAFLDDIGHLGGKLGPLLVQLPPSLEFNASNSATFFDVLRRRFDGPVACEPRHPSWFAPNAAEVLTEHRIARVAADPAHGPEAARPGGWPALRYYRLHGSPRVYYSGYPESFLAELAGKLAESNAAETWCIFDNTASGAAAGDALSLARRMREPPDQSIHF